MSSGGARHVIAELASQPRGAEVRLSGRVLALLDDSRVLLTDASGSVEVFLPPATAFRPGDIISLRGCRCGEAVIAAAAELMVPYRSRAPFPSPGGEYYRLHEPACRAEKLALRARCLAGIRAFFDERGYLEVQTPCRVRSPGLEPHLRAEPAGSAYLITSPEYHMKRLLAGGLERIYSLGPCWRGDEAGPHHLHEFCMLEWYAAYASLEELMAETEALLCRLAEGQRGGAIFSYQGKPQQWVAPFARLSVAQAFSQHAGLEMAGVLDAGELRRRAQEAGFGPFGENDPFEEVASRVLVEAVEPALDQPRPVFLHSFPAPLAALSQLSASDPTVAERFELYAGGIELANAFGELTDAAEQRRRLEQDQRARAQAGAPVYPLDERFLAALEQGMPPAAGIALGVDRLVMLLSDAADIRQVAAFAPDEV